jgi:hypothetical protein
MFPLLSLRTEVIFWVIGLGLTTLLVYKWKSLAKNRARNIFLRVGAIVLIQVLFLSATGLTINRYGEFYSSWYDLVGIRADLNKAAVSTAQLSSLTLHDIRKAKTLAGGSLVIKKVITGENSGVTDTVYVVLPPKIAKELRKNTNFSLITEDYKVVELFSGYPGVPATWIGALRGITALEKLENSNQIPQTIAIIPSINVAPGEDTECMNYRGGPQVETWLTKDMHLFAQKFIGIDFRQWATFGYSTGGWCAAEIAIRHQDQYSAAISLAGYFSPSYAFGTSAVEKAFLKNEYDLNRILKADNNSVHLLVIASKNDRFSYGSTQNFLKKAGSLVSIKYDEIPSGGHNLSVWRPYVTTGFLWLNQN